MTLERFNLYGTYKNLVDPSGVKFDVSEQVKFFRDMEFINLGSNTTAAISVGQMESRPYIIDSLECVNHTCKSFIPLDGDSICYFAPASQAGVIPIDQLEAFIVPKGTVVTIRPGVWHMAPFPYNCDKVNIMIIATERYYVNDTVYYDIKQEDRIKIV